MELREMDEHITYAQQLRQDTGPIVLINQFKVAPEDVERLLEVWAEDAAYMKQQPGFISTQLHRGIAGSTTFMNVAVWESARALGEAFSSPDFRGHIARYPESAVATRLREGRGSRDLRGVTASSSSTSSKSSRPGSGRPRSCGPGGAGSSPVAHPS
jgi:heme-degrading monooxygenase HmoA